MENQVSGCFCGDSVVCEGAQDSIFWGVRNDLCLDMHLSDSVLKTVC